MMKVTEAFPKKLKEVRRGRFLTQSELAELIGVSSQTIYKYENGIAFPPGDKVDMLMEVLDVTPNDLFFGGESSLFDKLNQLISEEVIHRNRYEFDLRRFGAEVADKMRRDRLKITNDTTDVEEVLKFRKWQFHESIISMIEDSISEDMEEALKNSNMGVGQSSEGKKEGKGVLDGTTVEEYMKDW